MVLTMDDIGIKKTLFKTALITSPIIASLIVTPIFIVSKVDLVLFPLALFLLTLITLLAWWIQRKAINLRPVFRFVTAIMIMQVIGFIGGMFLTPPFEMSAVRLLLIMSLIF